jgi:hypothetical protein
MHNGVYVEIHIQQGQSTRHGTHGHQIESQGVITFPQSQTRTEQAAWLTFQINTLLIKANPPFQQLTAKAIGGRLCIST